MGLQLHVQPNLPMLTAHRKLAITIQSPSQGPKLLPQNYRKREEDTIHRQGISLMRASVLVQGAVAWECSCPCSPASSCCPTFSSLYLKTRGPSLCIQARAQEGRGCDAKAHPSEDRRRPCASSAHHAAWHGASLSPTQPKHSCRALQV